VQQVCSVSRALVVGWVRVKVWTTGVLSVLVARNIRVPAVGYFGALLSSLRFLV
jgi:hypothetical protein